MCRNSIDMQHFSEITKYRELRVSAEDTGTLVARHNDSRSVSMGHSSFDVKPQLGVTPNYFQSSRVPNSDGSCMRALCVTQSAVKNGRRRPTWRVEDSRRHRYRDVTSIFDHSKHFEKRDANLTLKRQ